ncbi:hypothetical protein [Streptomyces sp. I05A-00742]|uniref:hypothetical protein n=1 Tax=Streptomyces sp. I05A-00742 TaxID=2732853 RepID=UPI001487D125|nr:hypothetical protein [Streptomyces sp. I05A-00742]
MTDSPVSAPAAAPDLIVPVQLHALVVNEQVRGPGSFQRFRPDFRKMLRDKEPAEPAPGQSTSLPDNGVYLQWQLPEALATGHYDPDTGETTFPLVPNRWLVVRHHTVPSGRPGAGSVRAAAWVVHSDYLEIGHYDSAHGAGHAPFLSADPATGKARRDWLGRAVDLREQPWEEPEPVELFLTAVGPGLPAFAAFQPYHPNVFSFHDTLQDLAGSGHNQPADTTLGYAVVGWYSDDDKDILRRAADIPGLLPPDVDGAAGVLRALGWTLPGFTDVEDDGANPGNPAPVRTVYSGTALGITWEYYGNEPESDRPDHYVPRVAVGHSTADALAALTADRTRSARTAGLVKALYHGTIDAYDLPDGEAELERAAHTATFGASAGGTTWTIVPRPGGADGNGDGRGSPVPARARQLPGWLDQLNADQREFDATTIELAGLRERLRTLWWLRQLPGTHPEGFDAEADAELEPQTAGSLAHRAATAAGRLAELAKAIPQGTTSEEVQAAIDAYSARRRLPRELELRRTFHDSYHRTGDPVVLVEGAGVKAPLTREPDDPLPCRTVDRLLEAMLVDGDLWAPPAELPPLDLPEPRPLDLPVLPTPGRALLAEFALLDRAARTPGPDDPQRSALHTALATPERYLRGTPAEYLAVWRQPWLPMYLQWDLRYCPAPFETREGRHRHWSFDGETYTWLGTGADPGNGQDGPEWISFANRAFLTPSVPYVLAAQTKRLTGTYAPADAAALTGLRTAAGDLDMLSQTLDGFNDHLLMQDTGVREVTPKDIAPLIGEAGHVTAPGPLDDDAEFRFQPVRAGQFYFRDLRIIDRFGRCAVLTATDGDRHLQFRPVVSEDATPSVPLKPDIDSPSRFVQLPPRLLQEARTRLRIESGADSAASTPDAGSPLSGWLLVNHLDDTLLVYGPGGDPLGELRVILPPQGPRQTEWTPLPTSPYPRAQDIADDHPHLAEVILELLGPTGPFTALMATLDARLSDTTDATTGDVATPARLIGRPVAVYRARLDLELKGAPFTNPGWHHALKPLPEKYPDYTWQVRLGDPSLLTDGLVGYYASPTGPGGPTDYRTLYVHTPEVDDPYLADIGNGASLTLPARPPGEEVTHRITVLADPYNPVHATTGILPVTELALPAEQVEAAVRRIRAAFRLGPLLAPVRTPAAPAEGGEPSRTDDGEALVMIRPAAWHGEWSWAEPETDNGATRWTERPLLAADSAPHPDDPLPHARAGYLMLRPAAFGEDPS